MDNRRKWEESRKTILSERIDRESTSLNRYKTAAFDVQKLAIQCDVMEFMAALDHVIEYVGKINNRISVLTAELATLEAKHRDEDTRFMMMMAD